MAESKQRIYTQAETEAVEVSESLAEFLLDKYSDYPSHVILAALLITVNSLTIAIDEKREELKKNEASN